MGKFVWSFSKKCSWDSLQNDVNSANTYTANLSHQTLISNEQLEATFPVDSTAFWFWCAGGVGVEGGCLNRLEGEIKKGQL